MATEVGVRKALTPTTADFETSEAAAVFIGLGRDRLERPTRPSDAGTGEGVESLPTVGELADCIRTNAIGEVGSKRGATLALGEGPGDNPERLGVTGRLPEPLLVLEKATGDGIDGMALAIGLAEVATKGDAAEWASIMGPTLIPGAAATVSVMLIGLDTDAPAVVAIAAAAAGSANPDKIFEARLASGLGVDATGRAVGLATTAIGVGGELTGTGGTT
jgi:hypothetical protein